MAQAALVFRLVGFPRRLLAHLLRHPGRWNPLLRQVVGDFLVTPALIVVQVKNLPDDLRFRRDNFKFLLLVDDVAVGVRRTAISRRPAAAG